MDLSLQLYSLNISITIFSSVSRKQFLPPKLVKHLRLPLLHPRTQERQIPRFASRVHVLARPNPVSKMQVHPGYSPATTDGFGHGGSVPADGSFGVDLFRSIGRREYFYVGSESNTKCPTANADSTPTPGTGASPSCRRPGPTTGPTGCSSGSRGCPTTAATSGCSSTATSAATTYYLQQSAATTRSYECSCRKRTRYRIGKSNLKLLYITLIYMDSLRIEPWPHAPTSSTTFDNTVSHDTSHPSSAAAAATTDPF